MLIRRIRFWLVMFMAGLVISGITAFPLCSESQWLLAFVHSSFASSFARSMGLGAWIELVARGIEATDARFPFLAYGTDWLAFGHLVIAIAFVGPYREPVRNRWVITFGLLACAGVIPLAFIAGHVRQIPIAWRLLDCSFGVLGAVPLLRCRALIARLERETVGV